MPFLAPIFAAMGSLFVGTAAAPTAGAMAMSIGAAGGAGAAGAGAATAGLIGAGGALGAGGLITGMSAGTALAGLGALGAVGGLIAGGVTAAQQADYQKKAMAAQAAAADVNNRLIRSQESDQSRKAMAQSRLTMARIRVTAGESGLGLGGTYDALMRQAQYDANVNQDNIHANAFNRMLGNSVMQPVQGGNGAMGVLMSGLGGFQTGMSIGNDLMPIKGRAA
jgi:hypothetical protein